MSTPPLTPSPYRWSPTTRASSKDYDIRLAAAEVMFSLEQMRDHFAWRDNEPQDLDSQDGRVWLKDSPYGQLQVSGSLNQEEGLSSYVGSKGAALPSRALSMRTEEDGTITYAVKSANSIEQVRSFPSGDMEYLFART